MKQKTIPLESLVNAILKAQMKEVVKVYAHH